MSSTYSYDNMKETEKLLDDLAEEIDPHIETISKFLENLKETDKPLSIFSTTSFIPKIESLRIGIFELAKIEEYYSLNILFRSSIEQFLKFQYLWMKTVENNNDEIGIDYWVFGGQQEKIDYAKALSQTYKMLGISSIKSALQTLQDLGIISNESSASQIKKRTEQFTYKSMTFYISEKTNKGESLPILNAVLPRYSELSSCVHGGPESAFTFSESGIKEAIEFSTFASLYTRYLSWVLMAQYEKDIFPACHIVKKYLDKYLKSSCAM